MVLTAMLIKIQVLWQMTHLPTQVAFTTQHIIISQKTEHFQHVISNFLSSTDCSQNKHAVSIFRFEGTWFMLMLK
jgi:hypothetical protein